MAKTPEEIRAYKQKRSKQSRDWYHNLKKDPVKWEEFKQKRRKREKDRYARMNAQLQQSSEGGPNDARPAFARDQKDHRPVRQGPGEDQAGASTGKTSTRKE